MEQPGIADLTNLLAREHHVAIRAVIDAIDHVREAHGHVGDAAGMSEGRRVALFDRVHRGLHESLEQLLDLLVQPAVLDCNRCLPGERRHQLHRALRVGHDLVLHVGRLREHGVGVALAVDELQDADDLFLVILHRDHEHRLRPIPVALVERAVDAVLDIGRQEVCVVDHQRLARHRSVAREARAIDRDRELHERRRGLGVRLRDAKAQPLLALFTCLDQVQAARVRRRDAAGLRDDELQQGLQVALGAERDADAGELADLAAPVRGLRAGARRLGAGGRLAIPRAHGHEELPRPHGVPHEAGQQLRGHLRGQVGFAVTAERHDRAPRVDERPQHVQREGGAALGVEYEHRRPLIHHQIAGSAHVARFDLGTLEGRPHGGGRPGGRVEQQVSHVTSS